MTVFNSSCTNFVSRKCLPDEPPVSEKRCPKCGGELVATVSAKGEWKFVCKGCMYNDSQE